MLYIVGGPGSLSHILRIMGRGAGGRGVVLYIVGGPGSLSHILRNMGRGWGGGGGGGWCSI